MTAMAVSVAAPQERRKLRLYLAFSLALAACAAPTAPVEIASITVASFGKFTVTIFGDDRVVVGRFVPLPEATLKNNWSFRALMTVPPLSWQPRGPPPFKSLGRIYRRVCPSAMIWCWSSRPRLSFTCYPPNAPNRCLPN